MNIARRTDLERKVAPIDGGERPRVGPGGRRARPRDWDAEEDVAARSQPRFEEELARQEGSEAPPARPPEPDAVPAPPVEDRLDLHGHAAAPPGGAPASSADEAPPAAGEGRHLDLRV